MDEKEPVIKVQKVTVAEKRESRAIYKKPVSEKFTEKTIVYPSKTKTKKVVERKYKNGNIKRSLVSVK